MNILLDTHIALWAISDSAKLSTELKDMLINENNSIFYSIASVWEVAIKHALYTNNMPMPEEDFVTLSEDSGFFRLDVLPEHIYQIKTLVRPSEATKHNDPFDRLMIAQAKAEDMCFVTHDHLLKDYNEPCVYTV